MSDPRWSIVGRAMNSYMKIQGVLHQRFQVEAPVGFDESGKELTVTQDYFIPREALEDPNLWS